MPEANPLLSKFAAPFGAVPFHLVEKRHFQPALLEAIAEAKRRVERVKASPATFEDSIVGLETASERANLVAGVFFNLLGVSGDDEMQAMARDVSPRLAAFASDVSLDPELFAKVKEVYDRRDSLALSTERRRLLEKTYVDFVRNGALLSAEEKESLRAIDQELARLGPEFSDNVLKATNAWRMPLSREDEIAGLPPTAVEAAAEAAAEARAKAASEGRPEDPSLRGADGAPARWLISLHAPSFVPFMTYSERRDLRERLWRAYQARAFGGPFDNQELAKRIAALRHRRANLLGFPTHAHFTLKERMAETPEKAKAFLERLIEKSRAAAVRDVDEVRSFRDQSGSPEAGGPFMPWDYAFWSERLKRARYDFDQEELRPYFPLEKVLAGAFEHARRLYGIEFKPVEGVPVYHPDVRVFEAREEADGRHVGLFYADFFPRPSKRGGAWMTGFRDQGLFEGEVLRPHVSIVCNFTPPTATRPALLSFDEVRTLFHEFGHALHGLLSQCTYPSLSGTSVYWDFVELPSQLMENWTLEKEALDLFAAHWQTGEKVPERLAEKVRASSKFQAGYASLRQLSFATLDMAWHAADPSGVDDVSAFEREATARTRVFEPVEGTNASCAFSHIFPGGYSAGYYSYKWAEVLDADAFEAFREKGLFNREVARSFRENVLSRGGTEHPMTLYKRFRGREPDPDALLRRDGLL